MKTCTKCKIGKPKTEFGKRAASKDGLQLVCMSCCAEYRKRNAQRANEYGRQYRKENADLIRAYNKANAARISERVRKYFLANKDKIAEYSRKYISENQEKLSARWRNRRARKRSAEGRHSSIDVLAIFKAQRGLCANCQTKLFKSGKQKYHVDHIMPLALGGSNWPSNLQCLCPACNLRKHAKDPVEWAQQNGRLL